MKLTIPVLAATLLFFEAASAQRMIYDRFIVTNTLKDGKWEAIAAWTRGRAAVGIKADHGCHSYPNLPYADVEQVCFDWTKHRGHIKVGNNIHCFNRKWEETVHAGSVWLSQWDDADCSNY